jgi:hypothetical protein
MAASVVREAAIIPVQGFMAMSEANDPLDDKSEGGKNHLRDQEQLRSKRDFKWLQRVVVVNPPGLAGVPVEVLFAARGSAGRDGPVVAYTPLASIFTYIKKANVKEDRPAVLLALGDPAGRSGTERTSGTSTFGGGRRELRHRFRPVTPESVDPAPRAGGVGPFAAEGTSPGGLGSGKRLAEEKPSHGVLKASGREPRADGPVDRRARACV